MFWASESLPGAGPVGSPVGHHQPAVSLCTLHNEGTRGRTWDRGYTKNIFVLLCRLSAWSHNTETKETFPT